MKAALFSAKKQKLHHRLLKLLFHFALGVLAGLVIIFLVLFFVISGLQKEYLGKVPPGYSIFSQDVSEKSNSQIASLFDQKKMEVQEQKLVFSSEFFLQKEWGITPSEIDFSLDKKTLLERLFPQGRRGGFLGLYDFAQLLVSSREIKPKFSFNNKKLDNIMAKIAKEIDLPAKNALFEYKEGKVTSFQPSEEGLAIDKDAAKILIIDNFSQYPFRSEPLSFSLPVRVVYPNVNTSDTNRLGISQLLAEGESYFKDSIPTRVHNILLAASKMHGIVVAPGETFSFAKNIGDISEATGYQKAYVIKENKTILEDGGGVCQVSTTMFRAALAGGFPIVERQAHYYRVGFYEQGGYPPGLDATVYPPSPDLKFKNDTSAYILIQTVVDEPRKRLAFQIYGTTDERRVEMTKPQILSQTPPPPDVYTDDPTLALGVIKKFDSAHWGAKVSFKRTVFSSDGTIKEEKTFLSNYTPWPAVYLQGTKTN